ncbi:hypothetical protein D3C86_1244320 [compost metagenome]
MSETFLELPMALVRIELVSLMIGDSSACRSSSMARVFSSFCSTISRSSSLEAISPRTEEMSMTGPVSTSGTLAALCWSMNQKNSSSVMTTGCTATPLTVKRTSSMAIRLVGSTIASVRRLLAKETGMIWC